MFKPCHVRCPSFEFIHDYGPQSHEIAPRPQDWASRHLSVFCHTHTSRPSTSAPRLPQVVRLNRELGVHTLQRQELRRAGEAQTTGRKVKIFLSLSGPQEKFFRSLSSLHSWPEHGFFLLLSRVYINPLLPVSPSSHFALLSHLNYYCCHGT